MKDAALTPAGDCLRIDLLRATFATDGVVLLRAVLNRRSMKWARRAFDWSIQHPGPGAGLVLAGKAGAFYQDHANPAAFDAYRLLLQDTGLADLIADLMDSERLWLLYEQIWFKHGAALPTPWHQDLPYVPMAGDDLATAWLSLDPIDQAYSLEFVAGSHRGPLYNPTAFDPIDPKATMFAPDVWPPLPDIETRRTAFPIVSFAIVPGDIVVFHPAILHGGAPTPPGGRRRTISLRFFGDRAYCAQRPEAGLYEADKLTTGNAPRDPMVAMARQPNGTLFRHPAFPYLRGPGHASSTIAS